MPSAVVPNSILAQLRKEGVLVRTEVDSRGAVRLVLKPTPPAELLDLARRSKDAIIAELVAERRAAAAAQLRCPHCKKPTVGRKCWGCNYSVCECGRMTESAFLSVCRACEVVEYRRTGEPF